MSEHKFKVGDRVREACTGDQGVVTCNDGGLIWVKWGDGSIKWITREYIEMVRPKAKSNGSVTQRLRRELDAKSEEVEKLNDQVQRLCKQIDDMVKERCALVADIDKEMDIKDARIRVLEGQQTSAVPLVAYEQALKDVRVLNLIETIMGLRGER